ncbi:MAG: hypothetical protein EOM20_05815 [Spartobacteria bacterium]|nr:hypothetical protein [Spartobacteria bacterium]
MTQALYTIDEISARIKAGEALFLAGDEKRLAQLPPGQWVGGTIPYFMTAAGGAFDKEKIFATILPDYVESVHIKTYSKDTLGQVYMDAPGNGFSFINLPAACDTLLSFALNAPGFEQFAMTPLIGWVSGVDMTDLGKVSPRVFNGADASSLEDGAVVMHVTLPPGKGANIGIINIFEQGEGADIVFPADGFSADEVTVDGRPMKLADYFTENNLDTKLPLVADYYGAMINTSIQGIDKDSGQVAFFAPVFKGMTYRHAKPIADYIEHFTSQIPHDLSQHLVYSCNCILNYLYSELEGRKTGDIVGPITFGEVAYQLLNQTLVYLTIHDV